MSNLLDDVRLSLKHGESATLTVRDILQALSLGLLNFIPIVGLFLYSGVASMLILDDELAPSVKSLLQATLILYLTLYAVITFILLT